jgi:dTDP-4-dehydrorhamnose reductase
MSSGSIIITGISGLAGGHLARRLNGRYPLIGISRHPGIGMDSTFIASLDLTDFGGLQSFLEKNAFDTIINCAALADVDRCEIEHELAFAVNTQTVMIMAEFCKKHNRLLIHLSTDYIFDGKAGPYAEDAIPNPINYYGVTKREAEEAIVNSGCPHIIVRTNHLYGNLASGPSNLVRWLLGAKDKEIIAADDQFNNATWAGNLADAIIELMESDFRGVINIGGPNYLSRYDFAILGTEIFGIDQSHIIGTSISRLGLKATRPLRAGLTIDKMKTILRTAPTSVLDGLKKVRDGIL